MISYLRGTIRSAMEDHLVLEVSGVGYELLISPGLSRYAAEHLGQESEFHVYSFIQGMAMGSGRIVLIGFQDVADKQLFLKLIQVSGIGPKAALKAMVRPARELAEAVEQGNVSVLTKLPGFGKRTAEKVIAQLKGKLYDVLLSRVASAATPASTDSEIVADAKAILLQLGYSGGEVAEMVETLHRERPDITDVQELIREIYQRQAKPRQ